MKSLFTNIPHAEGINAVAKALEKLKDITISNRVILKLLHFTLTILNSMVNIFFKRKDPQWVVKIHADLRTFSWMNLKQNTSIHAFQTTLAYFRFVDNIFMIWIGSKESLLAFFNEINTTHESIKFDCKYSLESINFLDTIVFKNNQRSLSTKLFSKLTDHHIYIINPTPHKITTQEYTLWSDTKRQRYMYRNRRF